MSLVCKRPQAAADAAILSDYLFMIPGKATPEQVQNSTVFLDTPWQLPDGRTLWPSDHYGVFAEVSLAPPLTTLSAR